MAGPAHEVFFTLQRRRGERDPLNIGARHEPTQEHRADSAGYPTGRDGLRVASRRLAARTRCLRRGSQASCAAEDCYCESLHVGKPVPLARSSVRASRSDDARWDRVQLAAVFLLERCRGANASGGPSA